MHRKFTTPRCQLPMDACPRFERDAKEALDEIAGIRMTENDAHYKVDTGGLATEYLAFHWQSIGSSHRFPCGRYLTKKGDHIPTSVNAANHQ